MAEEEEKPTTEDPKPTDPEPEGPKPVEAKPKGKTGSGLEPNVAGLLCYVLGFVTGIIFMVIEKEDKFVRFHAVQSTATFLSLLVIQIIAGFIPVLGLIIAPLVSILSLILWILLMVKAYQGEKFKLPIVGNIAEKNA